MPDAPEIAVELVSARAESYQPDSRKPDVRQGSLRDDVFRRDFTINTLLENLHTGETLDLTGRASDRSAGGHPPHPLEPRVTFFDDPLRMLRAVRFAARFGFEIEAETWQAICEEAERLRPPQIAHERIREEFVKIAKLPGTQIPARHGTAARVQPAGEVSAADAADDRLHAGQLASAMMSGRIRLSRWKTCPIRPVWKPGLACSGTTWASPKRRRHTKDAKGIRFHGHAQAGAELARAMMNHLKFSNDEIRDVTALVAKHMRLGEYRPDWTDASVKRLIRDCGPYLDDLFILTRCDMAAVNIPPDKPLDLDALARPH